MEMESWAKEQLHKLETSTKLYSKKEKTKIGYRYLKEAIPFLAEKNDSDSKANDFRLKLEELIDSLPVKNEEGPLNLDTYPAKLSTFKKEMQSIYNVISKGTYISQGTALGMLFGLVFGIIIIDSIALGMLLGLTFGVSIGTSLENQAKKEGRLL